MNLLNIVIELCIGNVTGWLVAIDMEGGETALLRNLCRGVLGAFSPVKRWSTAFPRPAP